MPTKGLGLRACHAWQLCMCACPPPCSALAPGCEVPDYNLDNARTALARLVATHRWGTAPAGQQAGTQPGVQGAAAGRVDVQVGGGHEGVGASGTAVAAAHAFSHTRQGGRCAQDGHAGGWQVGGPESVYALHNTCMCT